MDGKNRADVRPGMEVYIVLKQDQRTGKRTLGVVKALLTSAPYHTHGIKVILESNQVGRVTEIIGVPKN